MTLYFPPIGKSIYSHTLIKSENITIITLSDRDALGVVWERKIQTRRQATTDVKRETKVQGKKKHHLGLVAHEFSNTDRALCCERHETSTPTAATNAGKRFSTDSIVSPLGTVRPKCKQKGPNERQPKGRTAWDLLHWGVS